MTGCLEFSRAKLAQLSVCTTGDGIPNGQTSAPRCYGWGYIFSGWYLSSLVSPEWDGIQMGAMEKRLSNQ